MENQDKIYEIEINSCGIGGKLRIQNRNNLRYKKIRTQMAMLYENIFVCLKKNMSWQCLIYLDYIVVRDFIKKHQQCILATYRFKLMEALKNLGLLHQYIIIRYDIRKGLEGVMTMPDTIIYWLWGLVKAIPEDIIKGLIASFLILLMMNCK